MLISNSVKDEIISHDEFLVILKEKEEHNGSKNEEKIDNVLYFKYACPMIYSL